MIAASPALTRSVRIAGSRRRRGNLFFLGLVTVLLLSAWGPALLKINGFYAPELLAPPLAIYVLARYPRLARSILRCVLSPIGIAGALWISLVAVIGVLARGSIVGPYSEWRASLFLLYSFIFMCFRGRKQGQIWATRLMWVSFAALCLDVLFAAGGILKPGFLGQPLPDPGEATGFGFGRISVPALNIVVVSYLAARARRVGLLAVVLILGGVVSLGGHRVVLAATAISALFVPLVMIGVVRARGMPSRWLRLLVAPLVIVAMVAAFRSAVIQNYLEEARGIQNRLFTHTIDTLSGIQRGLAGGTIEYGDETIRAAYAAFVLTQWSSLLLPHGLGSREVEGKLGAGFPDVAARWGVATKDANTHDNTVLYAAYHHGLLVTGLIIVLLTWLLLHRLRIEPGLLGRLYILVAIAGVIMVDMIYPPVPGINVACIYGLFLGTLLNPLALRPFPVVRRATRRERRRGRAVRPVRENRGGGGLELRMETIRA